LKVFAANPVIVAMLEERGALLPSSRHLPRYGAVVHLA
jgi:hypothetical protein